MANNYTALVAVVGLSGLGREGKASTENKIISELCPNRGEEGKEVGPNPIPTYFKKKNGMKLDAWYFLLRWVLRK